MYFIDFVRGTLGTDADTAAASFEYRLTCSGILYNDRVVTFDNMKSDACAILATTPFALSVVNRPLDAEYPQELRLRFQVGTVTETNDTGSASVLLTPDEEIAGDFAGLLSVFTARLVTVHCPVQTTLLDYPTDHPFHDFPQPVVRHVSPRYRKRLKLHHITHADGRSEIQNPNPPPAAVSPERFELFLKQFAGATHAEAILRAARLYATALELADTWPDLAYTLLISSIETVAEADLSGEDGSLEDKLSMYKSLDKKAESLGLGRPDIEQLVCAAAVKEKWIMRKFKRFLEVNTPKSFWDREPGLFEPKSEDFKGTLSQIYKKRSELLHSGVSFPETTKATPEGVPARAMLLHNERYHIPPLYWFERLVHTALVTFIDKQSTPS